MTAPESAEDESAFATSGHSGEPALWMRTRRQQLAEVDLLRRTVIGEVDQVINFAPPEHLYGRLLGFLLPQTAGVPVEQRWSLPLEPPDPPPGRRTLLVCLPSTWVMLRSLVPALRRLPGTVAVHSAGPPVPATFQVAEALAGDRFRLVELLGSTETGAIGRREPDADAPNPPWELLDDVTAHFDGTAEQRLTVSSPRLARRSGTDRPPPRFTLDDVVRPLGPRRFERIGRASGLIKINGRRYQLERFEAALREAFPDREFACVATADDVRAEHFELYYTDRTGRIAADDLHSCLSRRVPGAPAPRRTHRVDRIPKSATGKTRIGSLSNRHRRHGLD